MKDLLTDAYPELLDVICHESTPEELAEVDRKLKTKEEYYALRRKYKLRTKYNLRSVILIINAVELRKIRIDDADFPYGSFGAFKASVDKIDYDNDEFRTMEMSVFDWMTEREFLEFMESVYRGHTLAFSRFQNDQEFDKWKASVLRGEYDD